MQKKLPYGCQYLDEDDYQAVLSVLQGNWLTQGQTVGQFEQSLLTYCGTAYATVCSSGTAALHILMLALGVRPGDEVITTPVTFASTANCVRFCQGIPVFADIDSETANLAPDEIEKKITPKTVGIIPVHFAGNPCDMESIHRIACKHGLWVIEDACHALGADYHGQKIGSCQFSQATVFSFHPVKHITTGEGGAVLTNDKKLAKRTKMFRTHGIRQTYSYEEREREPWKYEMVELGYNYRITDIQCALGVSQLGKLNRFLKRRREITGEYRETFSQIEGISCLRTTENAASAYHLFVLSIDYQQFGVSRTQVMKRLLKQHNIGTQVHYIPVYQHPYYRKLLGEIRLPNTESYYEKCLSIPLFPGMEPEDPARFYEALMSTLGVRV
ncbi:MAG: UDP-4-amino-4,6-dideoxy-N-acetyl-beta-L-altrosamine transaminase [bacterium]